jgi:hypothetical protein
MTKSNTAISVRRAAVAALAFAVTTVGGLVITPGIAAAASYSFDAGVYAKRQVRHTWWNNANADAYAVGLTTTGVDRPDATCNVQLNRTWYVRNPSGEREFHMEIQGGSFDRCRVTVHLSTVAAFRESSTGVLNPGQTKAWHWNDAHTDANIYLVGVVPQVTSAACAIEVTSFYRTQPDGENEFVYQAANVGGVACSAQLRHAQVPVAETIELGEVTPYGGLSDEAYFPDATVVVTGAVPGGTPDGPCEFTPAPMGYRAPGQFRIAYYNTGAVTCSVNSTIAFL